MAGKTRVKAEPAPRKRAARKPRAAKTVESRSLLTDRDSWFAELITGKRDTSGVIVNSRTAMGIAAYFACIRNISEDLGKLPLKPYRRLNRGQEEAPEHGAFELVHDEPNPVMTSMTFWETLVAHALGWSGGYAEIVRTRGGAAAELWPLDPTTVQPVWVDSRTVEYKVWNVGTRSWTWLPSRNVLHIRGLGFDGLTSYLLSYVAKDSLSIPMGAMLFSAAFFENGATASGILKMPNTLSEEAFKRLRDSFAERHAGAAKSHKPIILEEGLDWAQNSVDPEASQMIETLEFGVTEVCRLFRMQPHKVMQLIRTGYNTLFAENTAYVVDTLLPWSVRICQECRKKLLTPTEKKGMFFKHNFRALLQGDLAEQSAFLSQMTQTGIYSINDCREYLGENPIEGGDTHFVPANMLSLEKALAEPTEPEPEPEPEPDMPEDMPDEMPEGDEERKRAEAALLNAHRPLIAATYRRLMRVHDDKARRAMNRGDYDRWSEKFYAEHREYAESALLDVFNAFAGAYVAVVRKEEWTDTHAAKVAKALASVVDVYLRRVRLDEPDENTRMSAEAQADEAAGSVVWQLNALGSGPAATEVA